MGERGFLDNRMEDEEEEETQVYLVVLATLPGLRRVLLAGVGRGMAQAPPGEGAEFGASPWLPFTQVNWDLAREGRSRCLATPPLDPGITTVLGRALEWADGGGGGGRGVLWGTSGVAASLGAE